LYGRARSGHAGLVNSAEKRRTIAVVCSALPEGRARWSVRSVAQEAVSRKLVHRVAREIIRILLECHDLKPWRDKKSLGWKMFLPFTDAQQSRRKANR